MRVLNSALYDLAEAALGQNSSMQWSLNDAILKRQIASVFKRCSEGDLAAEDALDVVMDFTSAGVANNVEILERLFVKVDLEVSTEFPGFTFTALNRLQELLMGLNAEAEWATSDAIARREMYPLFVRLSVGRMEANESVITFCDSMTAKRLYYLELIQELTSQLAQEIVVATRSKEESTNGDS